MPTSRTQQRGSAVPSGGDLLQRVQNIENALGNFQGKVFSTIVGRTYFPPEPVSSFALNALQTSSITPVTLTGSPSVTATIGVNGDCYVAIVTQITGQASGDQGFVYCYVDGNNVIGSNNTWCVQGGYGGFTQSAFIEFQLSQAYGKQLTQGTHTFTLKYAVSPGGAGHLVGFAFNALTVTPI